MHVAASCRRKVSFSTDTEADQGLREDGILKLVKDFKILKDEAYYKVRQQTYRLKPEQQLNGLEYITFMC